MGSRRPESGGDGGADLVRLLDAPEAWLEVDDATLKNLFALQCHRYSLNQSRRAMELCGQMYDELERRLDPGERLGVERRLVSLVAAGHAGNGVLVPFIFYDPALTVVSTATLDYAVLEPPDADHGPFAGVQKMLGLARPASGLEEPTRAGILQGLVLLGDRRLLPFLSGCWEWLGEAGRDTLARATSDGAVTAGLVEFLLGWLEQTRDERNFGGILGTLCRLPSASRDGLIHDIERAFPFMPDQPPLRVVQSLTFAEYYDGIRGRLARLAEAEPEPKLTLHLEQYWCEP
ncbi:MAG: hypothetical protein U0840_09410 [Gemmataceae bacterium]